MKRRAHILKDNRACDYPQQCIWFDTETNFERPDEETIYHRLKFGYACYMRRHHSREWTDEKWIRFDTRTAFWDFVVAQTREQIKLYLFCHNTSFDLPVLNVFQELPKRGYTLRSAIIDAPPTILRFRRGTRCIMVLDTLNLWRMPLRELAKEIGTEKYEMPEDNDLSVEWETYGKRDVEIIRDACIKWFEFLETNDYGSFAPTLAGQAMRVFRHKYMQHKILLDDNEDALKLTRDGYYGGRNEVFKLGRYQDRFYLLDINSMYPAQMANHPFPYRLLSHTRMATIDDLQIWLKSYAVTARVVLRTSRPFAAVRDNHKLVFPIGEFECILATPELRYALSIADILAVKEVAVYEQAHLFTHMMHDMYFRRVDAKNRGRPIEAFMYRKLMNSFYGKWGQSGGKWIEETNIDDLSCKSWIELDLETNTRIYHRQLGGLKQRRDTETETRDSFPAIAGHVTAYARMELWDIITQAGIAHVYYCDTDSVLVNSVGRRNLEFRIDSTRLGGLSVKGEYDDIEIWGCKDYRFGEKQRTKGVRKDAVWITDHDVRQTKWSGLRGLVSAGIVDKPITKTIRKHLNRLYDKGVVLPDGTVQPRLILPE